MALIATVFYTFHAAKAETVNYLSARSDALSTLCIVAALLAYQISVTRRSYLYLIPALVGIFTKQTTAMFGPLLLLYIYFFDRPARGSGGLFQGRNGVRSPQSGSVFPLRAVVGQAAATAGSAGAPAAGRNGEPRA